MPYNQDPRRDSDFEPTYTDTGSPLKDAERRSTSNQTFSNVPAPGAETYMGNNSPINKAAEQPAEPAGTLRGRTGAFGSEHQLEQLKKNKDRENQKDNGQTRG